MQKLKIQTLDRRMSGHLFFKYRLEFPNHCFTDLTRPGSAMISRIVMFNDFCRHMTGTFGYGPNVEDIHIYADHFDNKPHWAFRPPTNLHAATIYAACEEEKTELEKLLVFSALQRT